MATTKKTESITQGHYFYITATEALSHRHRLHFDQADKQQTPLSQRRAAQRPGHRLIAPAPPNRSLYGQLQPQTALLSYTKTNTGPDEHESDSFEQCIISTEYHRVIRDNIEQNTSAISLGNCIYFGVVIRLFVQKRKSKIISFGNNVTFVKEV